MTRENIIMAALRLFLLRGYKSVSLIDVANEAGITKGGIYHYFSSKDDLLHISLHQLVDRLEKKYLELLQEPKPIHSILHSLLADREVERYFKDLLQTQESCPLDYAQFAIEIMRKFPDIQQRIEQTNLVLCQTLAQRLQQAMDNGEIKSGFDSFALAACILSLANGQNSLGVQFQTPAIRQQLFDTVSTMLGK